MSDLITAARKQVEYAQNELKSGDKAKALEHLTKAAGFLDRAANEPAPTNGAPEPTNGATADEPLSDDPTEAQAQLLARIGVPPNADWPTIKAAASEEQARELVLLGVAGQPGTYPDADYSLFKKYYEPSSPPDQENGLQSWAPKAEYATTAIWKTYNQSR